MYSSREKRPFSWNSRICWMVARSSSSLTRMPSLAAPWITTASVTSSFITCCESPRRSASSGVRRWRAMRS